MTMRLHEGYSHVIDYKDSAVIRSYTDYTIARKERLVVKEWKGKIQKVSVEIGMSERLEQAQVARLEKDGVLARDIIKW